MSKFTLTNLGYCHFYNTCKSVINKITNIMTDKYDATNKDNSNIIEKLLYATNYANDSLLLRGELVAIMHEYPALRGRLIEVAALHTIEIFDSFFDNLIPWDSKHAQIKKNRILDMDENERGMLRLQDFIDSGLVFELAAFAFADSRPSNSKVTYLESIYKHNEVLRKRYLSADDNYAGGSENSSQSIGLKSITQSTLKPNNKHS